ncbi:glycine--tRNA ligase [Mesomycoplasma neurolyticum]|uniref:Glycine--tRNA ligase n=1 Tax=Mesomycoplasma neurolyticum TaxID=2120 RepID=A0A449A4W0_9BACT|nr:glycine--tRNA ligase [Mesomycoplasma neurolyticum]VEU59203.1 Glycine--tRNA ligase [Mesomycoplasma neurolyticum]
MKKIQEIINHLKNFGFVFQGSEIYGGLANTWDYGPIGTLLFKRLKEFWWFEFINKERNMFGLDSKILMNPNVWHASGHVDNFSDPLIENKNNNKRYRADHIIEELFKDVNVSKMSKLEMEQFIKVNVPYYDNSPTNWSEIKHFNLMFETHQGVVEDKKNKIYLRPETAQGIFINFKNVQRTMRAKLPFGIGQIGKSFRNEVTPGNFIFRTREFEQMELEIFDFPETSFETFKKYVDKSYNFLLKLGINKENLRIKEHSKDELAHYSVATSDIEYLFPFGWGELLGIAHRGDFDLSSHMKHSNESLEYFDPVQNKKIIPHIIEPSMGADRLMFALLIDAYNEEELTNDDKRIVLKLDKKIVPFTVAVLPLVKKLSDKALEIFDSLVNANFSVDYDEVGSIGKRYRRQDAIGTFYCITIDYDTIEDLKVTIRHRDTMKQERIDISEIQKYLRI